MPAYQAVLLKEGNFDQGATAGTIDTTSGIGCVQRAMGGANQPLAGGIKKTVRLKVHFHGNVAAAIQISVHFSPEADGKRPATLPLVQHVKGHRQATFLQVSRMTQRDQPARQAFSSIQRCRLWAESAIYKGLSAAKALASWAP